MCRSSTGSSPLTSESAAYVMTMPRWPGSFPIPILFRLSRVTMAFSLRYLRVLLPARTLTRPAECDEQKPQREEPEQERERVEHSPSIAQLGKFEEGEGIAAPDASPVQAYA